MSGLGVRFAKEFEVIDEYLERHEKTLNTKVLEAGGYIEERAGHPDFHKFVLQYVFTKESLERFIEAVKNEHRQL